jgi:hypothetical protein
VADGFYREHTLLAVIILSAFVPTLISQQFFRPRLPSGQNVPGGNAGGADERGLPR